MSSNNRLSNIKDVPDSLDPEIRKDVQRLISEHQWIGDEETDGENTSNKVSKELCEIIKSLYSNGIPVSSKHQKDILDIVPVNSHSTIFYHVKDKCSHKYRERISYDECGWMRFYASKGAPSKTLSVLFNISQKRAKEHIIGNCGHGDSCPSVDSEVLRANSYESIDDVSSICGECKDEFEHKPYRERTFCSVQCRQIAAGRKAAQKVNGD